MKIISPDVSLFNVPLEGKNLEEKEKSPNRIRSEMQARAEGWAQLTPTERGFVIEDELAMFRNWLERRTAELDRMTAAGLLDPAEDELDAHRIGDSETATFPTGELVARPKLVAGDEAVLHKIYDLLAGLNDWVTVARLHELSGYDDANRVYSGLNPLRRKGLIVEGPTVLNSTGRRMKQYALVRD